MSRVTVNTREMLIKFQFSGLPHAVMRVCEVRYPLIQCFLVPSALFIDVVDHFDRLHIHAAHYAARNAMHMAYDTAHHVIHNRRVGAEQRLQAGTLQ